VTNQKYYTRKKAELISNGKIYIPNDIKLPYPLERSTAGPGAGSLSITLSFSNKNIKLEASKNQNESYSLQKEDNTYNIIKRGGKSNSISCTWTGIYQFREQMYLQLRLLQLIRT
jgi:hypothetical protein